MRIIYYKVTTGKRQYPAPRIGITIYKNKLSILKGSTVMNCLKFGGLFLKSVLDKGYSSIVVRSSPAADCWRLAATKKNPSTAMRSPSPSQERLLAPLHRGAGAAGV